MCQVHKNEESPDNITATTRGYWSTSQKYTGTCSCRWVCTRTSLPRNGVELLCTVYSRIHIPRQHVPLKQESVALPMTASVNIPFLASPHLRTTCSTWLLDTQHLQAISDSFPRANPWTAPSRLVPRHSCYIRTTKAFVVTAVAASFTALFPKLRRRKVSYFVHFVNLVYTVRPRSSSHSRFTPTQFLLYWFEYTSLHDIRHCGWEKVALAITTYNDMFDRNC